MMLAKIPVLVVVALGVFSPGVGAEVSPPAGFAALFNGTDFDGWFGHAGAAKCLSLYEAKYCNLSLFTCSISGISASRSVLAGSGSIVTQVVFSTTPTVFFRVVAMPNAPAAADVGP